MKYYLIRVLIAIVCFIVISIIDMTVLAKGSNADLFAKSFLVALIFTIIYYYVQLHRHSKYHR